MKRKTDCVAILLDKLDKNRFKKTNKRILGFYVSATFNQFYTLDETGLAPTIVVHTAKANLIGTNFYAANHNYYFMLTDIADGNKMLKKDIFKLIRAYETDEMLELSLAPIQHSEVYKVE